MNIVDIASVDKWDKRYIAMAEFIAGWSKGPRSKVGAVVVRPDKTVASLGFNGPPKGFDDAAFVLMAREEQHKIVVHAERNAIEQCGHAEDHSKNTMYVWPMSPCAECAEFICQAGIKRVVVFFGFMSQQWFESAKKGFEVFERNGVELLLVKKGFIHESR